MQTFLENAGPYLFPLVFAAMWLFVTTILAVQSGWFRLMEAYPDQPEPPLVRLRFLSGALGRVRFGGGLCLDACPSGLRVGMFRLLGPFCRDFLVPWSEVRVERTDSFFLGKVAELELGRGGDRLRLRGYVADRLARAVGPAWPEIGPFAREPASQALLGVAQRWLLSTAAAATFFIVAPRLLSGREDAVFPPIAVAVLFPAIVFGIGAVIEFAQRSRD